VRKYLRRRRIHQVPIGAMNDSRTESLPATGNRADIRVALAHNSGHVKNLVTDGHLRPCADSPRISVSNMGPNNGLTIFWVFTYKVQNNGHPVRNATVDDILFRE
jgi:hypothetical protein